MFFSSQLSASDKASAQLDAALYACEPSTNHHPSIWNEWLKKKRFEKVLKIDPDNAQQNACDIGNFYTARKQFKLATHFYLAQLRQPADHDDPDILESIGFSYARQAQQAPTNSSQQQSYQKLSDDWLQEARLLRTRLHLPPLPPTAIQNALSLPQATPRNFSTQETQHSPGIMPEEESNIAFILAP